jgi:hypothetical protein
VFVARKVPGISTKQVLIGREFRQSDDFTSWPSSNQVFQDWEFSQSDFQSCGLKLLKSTDRISTPSSGE